MSMLALAGCGEGKTTSPLVERGRQVYLSQCATCHGADPAQPGPIGPPVKAASRELLELRVLRGTYPPGYKPKRPTSIMQPMPALAPDIEALTAYLGQGA